MEFSLAPDRTGQIKVMGAEIAWAAWGPAAPAGPPIVLVHGASAHIGWWDAVIAPLARAGRTVVALELSGHGTSARRDGYDGFTWGEEVRAVTREVAGGPSLLVGHSLGGRVAVYAAAGAESLFPGLVIVDSPLRAPGSELRRMVPPRPGPRPAHPTLEAAIAAFRLRPREPIADDGLLRRVAAGAYVEGAEGWTLRADLSVFHRTVDEEIERALAQIVQPITFVLGTMSTVVDDSTLEYLLERHPGPTEVVAIEGYHHLTLDQGSEVAVVIADAWARLVAGRPSE